MGGCGARTSYDANPNAEGNESASAGAQGSLALCSGDLGVARSYPKGPVGTTAPLQCSVGIVAQTQGLSRLLAASAHIDSFLLDFPALESGSYTLADCARARLWMDGGLYIPSVFGPTAPQPQLELKLERGLEEVTGSLNADVCREIGQQTSGDVTWPIYDCVKISIPNLRARIEPTGACDCPWKREAGRDCSVGVCEAAGCRTVECPWNSAICTR